MPREWYAICKDCGKKYGYSDESNNQSRQRGLSRPERCPNCRKLHSREISTIGLSHFEMTPVMPIPATGLSAGRLGGLLRPPRVHQYVDQEPKYDFDKFGIKDKHIREYFNLLQRKQVTIIVAPTGAGKSTFIPYRLMVPPDPFERNLFTKNGQIVITQPRIQASEKIPLFVAHYLHGSSLGAGFDIGFRHSGSPSTDWRNKMVYMTDGTLINMIIRNELGRLSVIMIDEAHERSLNIDLILGLLKAQLSRYPKLKIIIASATINAGMFLEYFGGPKGFDPDQFASDSRKGYLVYDNKQIAKELKDSPVGYYGFPGKRQYPVDNRYRDDEPIPIEQWSGRMPDEMAKKVLQILKDIKSGNEPIKGDILGFLQGEAPIERAVEIIRSGVEEDSTLAGKVDVFPLFTKLPRPQQDLALVPKKNKGRIRVVISTNVAETSLTVDGIVHVVDSGLINEAQWDSKTQTSYVVPKIHSQAGCKQRWGRAGRIQAGVAHCLYTEEQFQHFPKYTAPEILRAPLDQVILTAKSAGVGNIQQFDWIQRPAQEELDRAPHYLQQVRALDKDGDLTDHGLELRNFGEEIDIANLMILADRFGCSVEMATILPMRRIGKYTSLLIWDKGWDAQTKRTVHRIHQGLIRPCLDDLEFSLKLWALWERNGMRHIQPEPRSVWCQMYFVNNQIMAEEIAPEREELLISLSGHKKEQAYRPIDFNLLTRLRILMTYGLPNQIYQLELAQKDGNELEGAPIYRPFLPETESKEQLALLHADATIEVSAGSICSDRAMEAFVCGKRQRSRQRMSPLAEPQTVITASFLTVIKPNWLNYVDQPIMGLARKIAEETRDKKGNLIASSPSSRLFVDQYHPIGSTFHCKKSGETGEVELSKMESPAPIFHPYRSNEDIEVPSGKEVLEAERVLRTKGLKEEDARHIVDVDDDEEETKVNWLEDIVKDIEPDSTRAGVPFSNEQSFQSFRGIGRIADTESNTEENEFSGVVTGFDLNDPQRPIILLDNPPKPSRFENFVKTHKVGSPIDAQIISIEQYVNDRLIYLVARENKTKYEIILDPYDASLGGRNFAIEQLSIGDPIKATVEEIDVNRERVRVTRLKESEVELLKFIGKEEMRVLPAKIVEVRDNGLYVWLDFENSKGKIPLCSFIYIDRLPQRPEEMWLGKTCKVRVDPRPRKNGVRRAFGDLDEEDWKKIRKFPWNPKIELDEDNRTITVNGRLSYQQRVRLLGLSRNSEYQTAVNILFRRSHELDARVIDLKSVGELASTLDHSKKKKWRVIRVLENTVVVSNGQLEVPVSKREAVFDREVDLKDKFTEGKLVEAALKEVNVETGQVTLDLRNPKKDPLRKYKVNQILEGKVSGFAKDDSGAFIRLKGGVDGFVYKDQVSLEPIENIRSVLKENQKVTARISELDVDRGHLRLSIYGLHEKVILIPATHIGMAIGRDGSVRKRISLASRSKIDIDQDGYCKIAGPSQQSVRKAKEEIDKILRMCIVRFPVDDLQVRKLVGRAGENINRIQKKTNTQIHIDKANRVTVTAPDQIALRKCLKQIRESILYFKAEVRVPAEMIGLVIGRRGFTIESIRNQTNVRIDISREDPGLIHLEGATESQVSECMGLIQAITSKLEVVSSINGEMPVTENLLLPISTPKAKIQKAVRLKGAIHAKAATRKTRNLRTSTAKKAARASQKKAGTRKKNATFGRKPPRTTKTSGRPKPKKSKITANKPSKKQVKAKKQNKKIPKAQ